MKNPAVYYSAQFNARASIPDHPQIFERWAETSAQVRRSTAGIFDLPFGESVDERLDFFPANRSDAPLLVFIHGGWWRSLDKSDFSFIAKTYTKAGYNVALTNYTLAPQATIEEITQQQLKAIAWLYRHAEHYEFDRERIVVAGHSAGAHLAAMMLAAVWPVYAPDLPADLLKGGILLSGLYDLAPVQHAAFVNVDLKLTPERVGPLSPALMPQLQASPFITAVGALESEEFHRQTAMLQKAWPANHHADIALPTQNHLTICDAFAEVGHPLHAATVALIDGL